MNHQLTTNHLPERIACHHRERRRETDREVGMFNTNEKKERKKERKLDTHMMFVTISQLVIDYVISALRHFPKYL
jgi:hypothetical protein